MARSGDNHNKNFLVGAVIGGVLGAVSALLLAPKAGCELREDISDLYENAKESTNKLACDVSERGHALFEDLTGKKARRRVTGNFEFTENIGDILNWATNGIKLWKTIKK